MRLTSLTLQNIRSYSDATIDFPEGMTLLSGDIGSGKSTILLALEFALFGIRRGEISGAALLRHGERQGKVSLGLDIAGKHITITRALKRGQTITQEAGTLEMDGVTTELTAVELKAKVLELLNYPQSLLRKGSLFRYTVFTPQEEMKAILLEKPEARLDTLRKLFDMDKYKRARENLALLLKGLRRDEAELEGRAEELAAALAEGEGLAERLEAASEKARVAATALEKTKRQDAEARAAFERLDKERFTLEEAKRKLAVTRSSLKHVRSRIEEVTTDEIRLQEQLAGIAMPVEIPEKEVLNARGRQLAEQERKLREKRSLLASQEGAAKLERDQAKKLLSSVLTLTECPTCRQVVGEEHKHAIESEEEKRITAAEKKLAELKAVAEGLAAHEEKLAAAKRDLDEKRQLLEKAAVLKESIKEKKLRLEAMAETKAKLAVQVEEKLAEEAALAKETEKEGVDERAYDEAKRALQAATDAFRAASVAAAEVAKEVEALRAEEERLAERQKVAAQVKKDRETVSRRIGWLSKHLQNVTHLVERARFLSAHTIFDGCFREWFSLLIEDESLTARLDADFTPVLTQNGYETELEHLSGGEKTSVALAYRLALNKVLNDFLSGINTKDLLILDEPTDGFSSEQLDRVREVLERLALKQVLIVSHETQMEGYVDHVLRVVKDGHESCIVS